MIAPLSTIRYPIREFLEVSNLHGLSHISKAKSTWGKILWAISVVVSFSLAAILINNSFRDWSDHPFSSVISTYSIKSLKFPNVTVCPPKGTNTALNHDLVNLKTSFTSSEKELLNNELNTIFFGNDNKRYARTLSGISNKKNLREIYDGFQTIPKQFSDSAFALKLSGPKGEIHSPKPSDKVEQQRIHYKLEFPEHIGLLVGETGELVLNLEIDTRAEGALLEYRMGSKYDMPGNRKIISYESGSWETANKYCESQGGHLASVGTKFDAHELNSYLSGMQKWDVDTVGHTVWLGGRNHEVTENWTWVDGTKWDYEHWSVHGFVDGWAYTGSTEPEPNQGSNKCLVLKSDPYEWDGDFYDYNCDYDLPFVCKYEVHKSVKEVKNLTFTFTKNNLPEESFYLWWTNSADPKVNLIGGFLLKWEIRNIHSDLEIASSRVNGQVETPGLGEEYADEMYKADRKNTFTLELPQNIDEVLGAGKLVVDLKVSTSIGDTVQYMAGQTFKYFSTRKTWPEAERSCLDEGSHLASVLNFKEHVDVKLAPEVQKSVDTFWLGGTYDLSKGSWSWVDGHKWEWDYWDKTHNDNDPKKTKLVYYTRGQVWRSYSPKAKLPYVCKTTVTMKGSLEQRWEYKAGDLTPAKITVRWEFDKSKQAPLANFTNHRTPGFNITWYIVDGKGIRKNEDRELTKETWRIPANPEYPIETKSFVAIVNAVEEAKEKGISYQTLMKEMEIFITRERIGSQSTDCLQGQTVMPYYVASFIQYLNLTYDVIVHVSIADDSLENGVELYSTLLYCPDYKRMDFEIRKFFTKILEEYNPRDMLQASVNMVNSDVISNLVNRDHMNQFLKRMQHILKIDLKHILPLVLLPSLLPLALLPPFLLVAPPLRLDPLSPHCPPSLLLHYQPPQSLPLYRQ